MSSVSTETNPALAEATGVPAAAGDSVNPAK